MSSHNWEDWVRALADSNNPRDTDLLIAKIKVEFIPREDLEARIEERARHLETTSKNLSESDKSAVYQRILECRALKQTLIPISKEK